MPVTGELLVLGAAILQELSSRCYLATVYEIRVSKPVKISSEDLLRQAALGVLMWGCRWRGLALQWASSNICLASEEEESPLPLLHLSPPKAFRRHGSHQAAYARPDVPSQGTHSLQSTAGALNKWLLRTKFECCKLLCDCSTKGKTWESHRHSCSFPAKSLKTPAL